jgi:uncharacterized protein (TIGR02266 family)
MVDYITEQGVRCDYATNLSKGGLFLETDSPVPQGSVVKMRFRVTGSDELHEVEGRVAWVGGGDGGAPGMGVEFADEAAAEKLVSLLETPS